MQVRLIHQWRDWILECVDDGRSELIHKENQSVQTILAATDMDAENTCQLIIKKTKEEDTMHFKGTGQNKILRTTPQRGA